MRSKKSKRRRKGGEKLGVKEHGQEQARRRSRSKSRRSRSYEEYNR